MAQSATATRQPFTRGQRAAQLLAPGAIIAIVGLMIVPLPPLLLDLLLTVDIGLAVVLLLTAIYVKEPVEFSVFPSLLLVLTLLRLSLNVAGTRLILLHGSDGIEAAGHVIMSFGQFVVGGNFVVGAVIFLVCRWGWGWRWRRGRRSLDPRHHDLGPVVDDAVAWASRRCTRHLPVLPRLAVDREATGRSEQEAQVANPVDHRLGWLIAWPEVVHQGKHTDGGGVLAS